MIRLVSHTALPTLSPATLRRPIAIAGAPGHRRQSRDFALHFGQPRFDPGSAVVFPDARPEERYPQEAPEAKYEPHVGVPRRGNRGREYGNVEPHVRDGQHRAHQVGLRVFRKHVSSRFHRKIAAIETQVAKHLAQVVVLHLRQLLRVQAHRRLAARFRAAGLVLLCRRAPCAAAAAARSCRLVSPILRGPPQSRFQACCCAIGPITGRTTFFPWYAVTIM